MFVGQEDKIKVNVILAAAASSISILIIAVGSKWTTAVADLMKGNYRFHRRMLMICKYMI